MRRLWEKIKDFVVYDADREFYAKVFPGSVSPRDLMKVRYMGADDLAAVLKIEAQNYNYPWTQAIFQDCLRAPNYTCWVIEGHEKEIKGYCIVSMAAGEAHIMNLCVAQDTQGMGAGRKMMEYAIDYLRGKAQTIFLEVRPSNQKAIKLYQSLGFNEIGVRKDYYPTANGREDAIMLALELVTEI
jgi:ribosomal-protein-alanine N-acetyltransferase